MIRTILIVDNDQNTLKYLKEVFTKQDFKVYTATTGINAIQKTISKSPSIILLYLELSEVAGESICKEIKSRYPEIPVIIISEKTDTSDIVNGFDIGADDYITKPYVIDELIARVNSRIKENVKKYYQIQNLVIDDFKKKVTIDGEPIVLTPREYRLLRYLINNKDRVLSRDLILNRVWVDKEFIDPRVVDVYIGYLRYKLDKDDPNKYIKTVRGFGYKAVELPS